MFILKEIYDVSDFKRDFPNEKSCLDYLIKEQYPDGCPKCQKKLYRINSRKTYACINGHHVSPTSGTIFHKSRTPLVDWFYVIYLYALYDRKLSAKQIERHIKVSYKTAWRMLDLIKEIDQPGYKEEIKKDVGVYPTDTGKFRSRTKVGNKTINLGTFSTHEAAREAYMNAKKILRTKERYNARA